MKTDIGYQININAMEKNKTSILLAEDDMNLGAILVAYLEAKGYSTTWCKDGSEAMKEYQSNRPMFCIFDVAMPEMDGFELACEIRKIDAFVPIIFLTAKNTQADVLKGFEVGADDYITKPFDMEELIARLRAIYRRVYEHSGAITEFNIGSYFFDYSRRMLTRNGVDRRLTSRESDLLFHLCQNKNAVLRRSDALNAVWREENFFNARSMDVYITKLRKILSEDPKVEIMNVHGVGFKLVVAEE